MDQLQSCETVFHFFQSVYRPSQRWSWSRCLVSSCWCWEWDPSLWSRSLNTTEVCESMGRGGLHLQKCILSDVCLFFSPCPLLCVSSPQQHFFSEVSSAWDHKSRFVCFIEHLYQGQKSSINCGWEQCKLENNVQYVDRTCAESPLSICKSRDNRDTYGPIISEIT